MESWKACLFRKLNPGSKREKFNAEQQQTPQHEAALQQQWCVPTSPSSRASALRYKDHLRHLQRLLPTSGNAITNREQTEPQTYLCITARCSFCECVWYTGVVRMHDTSTSYEYYCCSILLMLPADRSVLWSVGDPMHDDMSGYQLGLDRSSVVLCCDKFELEQPMDS